MAAEPQVQARIRPSWLGRAITRLIGTKNITAVNVVMEPRKLTHILEFRCVAGVCVRVRDGVDARVHFDINVGGVTVMPGSVDLVSADADQVALGEGSWISHWRFQPALTHARALALVLDVAEHVRDRNRAAEVQL